MRIIANIPHPKIGITVFSMNDKYIVKFEAGPMEQSFKFLHTEVNGVDGIIQLVDDVFIEKVRERFNEMFLNYSEGLKRYQQNRESHV